MQNFSKKIQIVVFWKYKNFFLLTLINFMQHWGSNPASHTPPLAYIANPYKITYM